MSIAEQEFLAFLADDMMARPAAIEPLPPELTARVIALTADISISLTDEIEGVMSL